MEKTDFHYTVFVFGTYSDFKINSMTVAIIQVLIVHNRLSVPPNCVRLVSLQRTVVESIKQYTPYTHCGSMLKKNLILIHVCHTSCIHNYIPITHS